MRREVLIIWGTTPGFLPMFRGQAYLTCLWPVPSTYIAWGMLKIFAANDNGRLP